ncbi:hypothetical protein B9Z55_014935 [Caenorhabditis nigoni]|uniref:Uncharacterized protein n=1 Tax=Caenorhabditis nigoni TaxID=1611254 RepID=A0A2G5U7Y6_9PELO|nr:hypothetical protein B9Z55_014935 [Caenorhabditis nigoni]
MMMVTMEKRSGKTERVMRNVETVLRCIRDVESRRSNTREKREKSACARTLCPSTHTTQQKDSGWKKKKKKKKRHVFFFFFFFYCLPVLPLSLKTRGGKRPPTRDIYWTTTMLENRRVVVWCGVVPSSVEVEVGRRRRQNKSLRFLGAKVHKDGEHLVAHLVIPFFWPYSFKKTNPENKKKQQ